ncbi:hypothetical protein A6A12_1773 [Vibrio anguillarum]|nr:hypothetical protein A6A12_1773 [Vibrio anguillarum]
MKKTKAIGVLLLRKTNSMKKTFYNCFSNVCEWCCFLLNC